MKKIAMIVRWTAVIAGMAAPAIAAAKRVDDASPLVMWAFLSFCGLIIVNQLMPVISELIEASKRAKEAHELAAVTEKGPDSHAGQWRSEK